MKKKVFAAALVALSMVGFSSYAQDNTTNTAQTCATATTCVKNAVKGQRGDRQGRKQNNPFEGITLTESQQTQLDALQAKRQAARAERAAQRQANDSVRIANRKASQKEYLEEVKSIIGPDNYVVFLENIVVNGSQVKAGQQAGPRQGKQVVRGGDRTQRGKDGIRAHRGGKQLRNAAKQTVEKVASHS